ncbi:nucleotidyl transferase AbiEii/AbiGii toxin family protein [Kitasatospora sp. NPDC088391]|uniref:nucleotidyl transferase AbiEii/AbiGii toxin family protein n=1 Tax=Kitasatospora sp. NPDC088391 TaxID=3364074 RepID=UPI00380D758E
MSSDPRRQRQARSAGQARRTRPARHPGQPWDARRARRAVLDHLLALLAASPWSETLVLRGSMVMPAWVGPAAREPADLDFLVPPSTLVPIDVLDPYPYLPDLAAVQQWPEAADGAGAHQMWEFEEFDTGGLRAHLPPEGLHWVPEAEPETTGPEEVLRELVERHPQVAPGLRLDPASVRETGTWAYDDENVPGVGIEIRWTTNDTGDTGGAGDAGDDENTGDTGDADRTGPEGTVTVDFARDERMPAPPVRTAVPRGNGTGTTVVRTPSPELALAWKLLWLHADGERARAKDLYDAVLLAEHCARTLEPALLRRVLAREPGHPGTLATALPAPPADWADLLAAHPGHPVLHGSAEQWAARLHAALAPPASPADGRRGERGPENPGRRAPTDR